MELAIDTSTNLTGIVLSEKGEIIAECSWHSEHNHTIELIPNLISMLSQQSTTIHNIENIVVAKGPGSFNGIRVGLSTAKVLSAILEIPLVGISTLEAIAYSCAEFDSPICPIMQAGRGEISTAKFQMQDGNWIQVIPEHVSTVDDLCSSISEKTVFCGEISENQLDQIRKQLPELMLIPHEKAEFGRVGYLAKLGWCRIKAGDFDDAAVIQPLYLKKPSVTKPKRRKHDAMSSMRTRS